MGQSLGPFLLSGHTDVSFCRWVTVGGYRVGAGSDVLAASWFIANPWLFFRGAFSANVLRICLVAGPALVLASLASTTPLPYVLSRRLKGGWCLSSLILHNCFFLPINRMAFSYHSSHSSTSTTFLCALLRRTYPP